jgi:hypothetical protein
MRPTSPVIVGFRMIEVAVGGVRPMHRAAILFGSDVHGFNAEATDNLCIAFDTAWQVLKTRQPAIANAADGQSVRETLAKHIIDYARQGVSDPLKLANAALTRIRL